MYLGRCFFTTDNYVGSYGQSIKLTPRLCVIFKMTILLTLIERGWLVTKANLGSGNLAKLVNCVIFLENSNGGFRKMKLGVKNGTVSLVDPKTDWSDFFLAEKKKILSILPNENYILEHIGSTSILGIVAKPIIDMALGLPNFKKSDEFINLLTQLEYKSKGYYSDGLGFVLVKEKKGYRTHCIHLLDMSLKRWDDCIYFRDQLNSDQNLRVGYANFKKELEKKYSDNRKMYTSEKNIFVNEILNKRKV